MILKSMFYTYLTFGQVIILANRSRPPLRVHGLTTKDEKRKHSFIHFF